MRTSLEVLNSFDLIIATSTMQSADESVSVSKLGRERIENEYEKSLS